MAHQAGAHLARIFGVRRAPAVHRAQRGTTKISCRKAIDIPDVSRTISSRAFASSWAPNLPAR